MIISHERSGRSRDERGVLKDMTTGEEVKELGGQTLGTVIYVNIEISKNSVRGVLKRMKRSELKSLRNR